MEVSILNGESKIFNRFNVKFLKGLVDGQTDIRTDKKTDTETERRTKRPRQAEKNRDR